MNLESSSVSKSKPKEVIVKYDVFGKIEEVYDSISNITNYSSSEIKKVIKSKKALDFSYYRKF